MSGIVIDTSVRRSGVTLITAHTRMLCRLRRSLKVAVRYRARIAFLEDIAEALRTALAEQIAAAEKRGARRMLERARDLVREIQSDYRQSAARGDAFADLWADAAQYIENELAQLDEA